MACWQVCVLRFHFVDPGDVGAPSPISTFNADDDLMASQRSLDTNVNFALHARDAVLKHSTFCDRGTSDGMLFHEIYKLLELVATFWHNPTLSRAGLPRAVELLDGVRPIPAICRDHLKRTCDDYSRVEPTHQPQERVLYKQRGRAQAPDLLSHLVSVVLLNQSLQPLPHLDQLFLGRQLRPARLKPALAGSQGVGQDLFQPFDDGAAVLYRLLGLAPGQGGWLRQVHPVRIHP